MLIMFCAPRLHKFGRDGLSARWTSLLVTISCFLSGVRFLPSRADSQPCHPCNHGKCLKSQNPLRFMNISSYDYTENATLQHSFPLLRRSLWMFVQISPADKDTLYQALWGRSRADSSGTLIFCYKHHSQTMFSNLSTMWGSRLTH